MKNISKIIMLILFFIPCVVYANDDYKVNDYSIEIDINNKNEYDYNESLDIMFNKENVYVTKEVDYFTKDIKVNSNYVVESRKNKLIKVNSGRTATKTYNYKYLYTNKKQDKNLYKIDITNSFNNTLNNVNFAITLPSSFSKNNLVFYINGKKISNSDVDLSLKNKTLNGKYPSLKENDTLTIEINYGKLYLNKTTIISIILPIALSIISYLLWYIYGKDLQFKITKTAKIPYGCNPLDVALIYNGEVTEQDSFYLLLHLANKGYISIIEKGNNDFIITRNKNYDGKNYKEASFFKALFKKSSKVSISDYVNALAERRKESNTKELDCELSPEIIYSRFQRASKNVLAQINTNEEKKKYFEEKSDRKRVYLLIAITVILVTITSIPFIEINKLYLVPVSVIFSIVTLFLLENFISHTDFKNKNNKIMILSILAFIIFIIMLIPSFKRNRVYLLAFAISCLCVGFILILYKYMPKRTIFGTKQYSKLEGLKLFLNELNNKELDSILELNNNYLYDILPYAYILGETDSVFKKIKEYNIPKPTWYNINDFTARKLFNSITRLNEQLKKKEELQ